MFKRQTFKKMKYLKIRLSMVTINTEVINKLKKILLFDIEYKKNKSLLRTF